jgi:hypothetical protein
MAIKEKKRAAEIICGSRMPISILGLLEAILSARIASACAHDARPARLEQSTESTGEMKREDGVCRMNQQYLSLITMMPGYHRRPQLPRGE